jgi:hypothetical protein
VEVKREEFMAPQKPPAGWQFKKMERPPVPSATNTSEPPPRVIRQQK